MRVVRAVGFTPSAVDLVPVALSPRLGSRVMALPAVRTEPVVIRLFFGKAEKGSHPEQLLQRLCVGLGIISGPGPQIRESV
jgi:hypothetical protein